MPELVLDLGDVSLTALTYGSEDGPLALCLHGFPDTAYTWRHLGPHLAARGYRVVAPFMRGYAPSSTSHTHNYQLATLANDANRIHEQLSGDERAVLIGHDWGAAATYPAIAAEPHRWRRAVTLAVPPLSIMGQGFTKYDQLRSSWYMFFFQSPLADVVVGLDNRAFLARLWRDWSPDFDGDEDMGLVRECLADDDQLHAALDYYRAMFTSELIDPSLGHVQAAMLSAPSVASLYLHGADDGCVMASTLGDVAAHLAPGSRFMMIEDAGHWLHLEQPDEVHTAIDSFLGV